MKTSIAKTLLVITLLVAILVPTAQYMTSIQEDIAAHDADHIIRPLLSLYSHSAANSAHHPVAPLMDIEDIWAIEDMRTEAEQPLLCGMRNGNEALGYDAASRTFFCTIGTSFTDGIWPELELYAQSTDGQLPVQIAWASDYAYDWPEDAVENGYSYELFAYTENKFQYFNIIFTGLPIVTLSTETKIENEYIPACVSISASEFEPVTSIAQVHLRGGGYGKPIDKWSYRIEFQSLSRTGRAHASSRSILGMDPDSDWLLLSNANNKEAVHNYLAFDLWNRWSLGEHLFMQQQSRLVELFVGNEYMGIYQLMQRVNPPQEILDAGGSLSTDMVVRLIAPLNYSDRPIQDISSSTSHKFECMFAPNSNADMAFSTASIYSAMNGWLETTLTDEQFTQLVQLHVDIENFISFYLFSQISGLTADNAYNNLYLYMLSENGAPVIHLSPWDLDWAFFCGYLHNSPEDRINHSLRAIMRMLDLNVMNCREMLHNMYRSRCETILSDSAMDEWILSVGQNIGVSGAYLRESEKWYGMPERLDLSHLLAFEKEQVSLTGEFINERWPLK